MTQVGEYFAKMLLARRRKVESDCAKREALTRRARAELEVSLNENAAALNSFPGIEEAVVSIEDVEDGFVVKGLETGFVACLTFKNGRLRLGPYGSDLDEDDEPEEDNKPEWYDLQWSNKGVEFTSFDDNHEYWVQYGVSLIVSRAFGFAINGKVSPRFGN
jgi:hypothetical protein